MEKAESVSRTYGLYLALLALLAFLLAIRLIYVSLSNPSRFPIHTVQIEASYEHITRDVLERILSPYLKESFFGVSTRDLEARLQTEPWAESAAVKRKWPDMLQVTLIEKKPIAIWNDLFLTQDYTLFKRDKAQDEVFKGPYLYGPPDKAREVLQTYEKLSKLLDRYGLSAASLTLRKNQSWELTLTNGVKLRLGKRDLEARLKRFCRAYPAVFGERPELLSSVDLRYPRGMAAEWTQHKNKSR